MSDSPEEIFETVRKSREEGSWIRVEIEDGRGGGRVSTTSTSTSLSRRRRTANRHTASSVLFCCPRE